ncbi:efflux RND transporter periplasmic adaptor subunit [Stieleria sp. ICT_E10.1]|uniref:efflux RND transporter periplasmic adaptor subunit n=1 Tax=Stieleria sedimenti TaxID=2976331 RepID=UPI0021803EC6|nr:efflux RND transporter periplasmic adaptor subunit [Stieleria sedimenti]MCS7468782.1 efflux RND transporter periplasmic adaptor subunit [Stieleria sedimenti]
MPSSTKSSDDAASPTAPHDEWQSEPPTLPDAQVDRGLEQRNSTDPISATVLAIAAQSSCPTEFLKQIAGRWLTSFSADVVAVAHPNWPAPMVLASDAELTRRLDPHRIGNLLAASTSAATACDLPLQPSPDSPLSETLSRSIESTGPDSRNQARGLHVRLMDGREPCAVLLIYADRHVPDVAAQIRQLRQLAEFAGCCRIALHSYRDDHAKQELPVTGIAAGGERALRHFHRDLDVTATAYRIANETRRVLAFDRVTVLVAKGRRLRVESVSGVAVVDRRANAIAAAETLAQRALVLGRPIKLPSSDPLPPQLADPLDHYLEETDVASVWIMPLYQPLTSKATDDDRNRSSAGEVVEPSHADFTDDLFSDAEPIGVLLLESFSEDAEVDPTAAMREIAAEAAMALANSREHQRIFGLRVLKSLGDWFGGRRLPYTTLGLMAIVMLLIAATMIQVDHKIIATGFAEPSGQQNVFARTDGVVKEIYVRDGQQVAEGDLLMRLENADLESTAESLSGEIQTTAQRLTSIRSMLLDPATDAKQSGRMAIEQRQLQSELNNLQSQLDLVRNQLSELQITAPIDGVVSAWQLKRKLSDRPVARGNHLLSIVRTDGPWQLRLEIPDEDAAEIFRASTAEDALKVEFAAASHPESTFVATLQSVSGAARRNAQGATVIDAIATVDPPVDADRRFGMQTFASADAHNGVEATAKIRCGRRSILGSWFGDVADFVHRNLLFYVR